MEYQNRNAQTGSRLEFSAEMRSNNAINTDSEKRRAFVAPLFTAGYGERYAP